MPQLVVLTLFTVALAAGMAQAQPSSQPNRHQSADPASSMWNPQAMIEQSVDRATARYHLTPEQKQLARKMTIDGVNAFLDKHEQELRAVVGEAVRARMSAQAPTSDQAKAWAEKAYPLFEEAKKLVIDGNRQFRDSLTDEQKKVFDDDQKTMEQQFSMSRDTLDRWKKSGFDASIDWTQHQAPSTQQLRQPRPELDRFERYARRFVENYKLDPAQTSQVLSIASQSRRRAEEHWYGHKTDIQAVRNRVQELSRDPKSRQRYLEATRQLAELNKPVNDLYNEMRERLDRVPTDAQRKAYDALSQARREAWREQIRRTGQGNTAVSSTSQMASSQAIADGQALAEGDPVATRPAATRPAGTRPATSRPATQPAFASPLH